VCFSDKEEGAYHKCEKFQNRKVSFGRALLKESRKQQRKWEEAWEIAKMDGAIARGQILPNSYVSLLSKYNE
jgi:hypothetical protein